MVKTNSGFKEVLGSELTHREKVLPNDNVKSMAMTEEGQFLSLLLHKEELVDDVIGNSMIDIDYFYIERNGLLFGLILLAYQRYGGLLTEDALEEYTRNSPTSTDERVFFDKIKRIRSKEEDYQRLKRNIVNRYLQQRFYELCWVGENDKDGLVNQILNASTNQTELISSLQDKLLDLSSQFNKDSVSKVSSLSEVLDRVITDIQKRRDSPGSNWGWLTGFKGLDDVIYGLRPGDYAIVTAGPNGGKTTFMLNLALGMAQLHEHRKVNRPGARVCYVTVESDDEEITERMLSNWSEVSSAVLKEGGTAITQGFFERVLKHKLRMQNEIGDRFTIINVTQGTPVTDLLALIDAKRRVVGFDVVFVDYLDVISSVRRYPNATYLEIGEVSQMLQAYGKRHGLVMVTAQSLNNEMIKLIKKQQLKMKDSNSSSTDVIDDVIGLEGIGGYQKLGRDADFVWSLMLGVNDTKMNVYWLKSRKSGKPKPFELDAHLQHCRLTDSTGFSQSLDGDEIVADQKDPEETNRKIVEREKASLNHANLIVQQAEDPRINSEEPKTIPEDIQDRAKEGMNQFFETLPNTKKENSGGQSNDKETDLHSG